MCIDPEFYLMRSQNCGLHNVTFFYNVYSVVISPSPTIVILSCDGLVTTKQLSLPLDIEPISTHSLSTSELTEDMHPRDEGGGCPSAGHMMEVRGCLCLGCGMIAMEYELSVFLSQRQDTYRWV